MLKKTHNYRGNRNSRLNLIGNFLLIVPQLANRGLSRRLMWSVSGDEREKLKRGCTIGLCRLQYIWCVTAGPTQKKKTLSSLTDFSLHILSSFAVPVQIVQSLIYSLPLLLLFVSASTVWWLPYSYTAYITLSTWENRNICMHCQKCHIMTGKTPACLLSRTEVFGTPGHSFLNPIQTGGIRFPTQIEFGRFHPFYRPRSPLGRVEV
jgi:hypothetical protein